jgi:hypothetical protein
MLLVCPARQPLQVVVTLSGHSGKLLYNQRFEALCQPDPSEPPNSTSGFHRRRRRSFRPPRLFRSDRSVNLSWRVRSFARRTLADRTRFVLDAEKWKAFLAALDATPRELPRLKRLFKEPSVFEGGKLK